MKERRNAATWRTCRGDPGAEIDLELSAASEVSKRPIPIRSPPRRFRRSRRAQFWSDHDTTEGNSATLGVGPPSYRHSRRPSKSAMSHQMPSPSASANGHPAPPYDSDVDVYRRSPCRGGHRPDARSLNGHAAVSSRSRRTTGPRRRYQPAHLTTAKGLDGRGASTARTEAQDFRFVVRRQRFRSPRSTASPVRKLVATLPARQARRVVRRSLTRLGRAVPCRASSRRAALVTGGARAALRRGLPPLHALEARMAGRRRDRRPRRPAGMLARAQAVPRCWRRRAADVRQRPAAPSSRRRLLGAKLPREIGIKSRS